VDALPRYPEPARRPPSREPLPGLRGQPGNAARQQTPPPVPIPASRQPDARKRRVRDKPTEEAPVKHVLGLTCKASTGTGQSRLEPSERTSCTGFKAAPRDRSRRRLGAHVAAPLMPQPRLRSSCGGARCRSAGAKGRDRGRGPPRKSPSRSGFDRGPLAAAPSGLCGRSGKAARSRTSVQPPPPCQIRRSVCVGLTGYGSGPSLGRGCSGMGQPIPRRGDAEHCSCCLRGGPGRRKYLPK
jgi:hypothetical protein